MINVKANSFELVFITGISVVGACLFTFLFGLSAMTAIGISLILLTIFASFYLAVQIFLFKNHSKKPVTRSKKTIVAKEKSAFVVLGETNDRKLSRPSPSHLIINNMPVSKFSKIPVAPVIERKNPMESFKSNPIKELEEARDYIVTLLDRTRNSYGRIERIFGERMYKNTRTDIQNFLYLKQLNESLEKRLGQVIDVLDEIEKSNKLSLKKSFELAYGPLALPKDSISALKSENEIPPLPREDWEKAVFSTLKKLSRKKTFHHALNYAIYS